MMSASKGSLLDYFQATKKLPSAGKRHLEALQSGKEAKSKSAAEISRPTAGSQKPAINADVLVNNLKRPKSTSDDNNNDSPIRAAKRFCAKKQSSLSVLPAINPQQLPTNDSKKPGKRFDRLKQLAANAKETLKQSQNRVSPSVLECVPAYERFSALVEDESEGFILPHKYKLLLDTFQSLETVVSMLYNRKELCFVDKIVPSVKQLTRRSFDATDDLGKIVRVHPQAYRLKLEPVPLNSFYNKKSGQVELTVNPDLSSHVDQTPVKLNGFLPMTPKILTLRKSVFKKKLIDITKIHHEKFLQSLNLSVNKNEIRRWHPSFKVDLVADIEAADIPQVDRKNQITTAKEVLEKVRGMYCQRIDTALETVAALSTNQSKVINPEAKIKPAIKGIPQGLLEKIRAKEAAKALSIISRDTETEKKQRMVSRLPEIARILKTLFVQDQQTSLIAPYVFDKIADSYVVTLSPEEIESHLKLLSSLVPEWLSIVNLRDGAMYYKLQRQMDFNLILKKIVAAKV